MSHRLLQNLTEPTVAEAAQLAQEAIDRMLTTRLLFRPDARTEHLIAQIRIDEAHANAALAGAEIPRASYADALIAHDPVGNALRSAAAIDAMSLRDAHTFVMSPPRALGSWHLLASAGINLPDQLRGRPRSALSPSQTLSPSQALSPSEALTPAQTPHIIDPLHADIEPQNAAECIAAVVDVVTTTNIPAVTAAAVVHALLAAGQPFASANALLGRAALRGLLSARGSDPQGLAAVNTVLWSRGRPAYVRALRNAIADGHITPEWFQWHAALLVDAATLTRERGELAALQA